MIRAWLIRDEVAAGYIRSHFVVQTKAFHVIERPWLYNRPNVSCIPANCLPDGVYMVDYLERSASGKYRNVYWVRGVPGRTGILIHGGNLVSHSLGCLILGMRRGSLAGQPAVLNSRTAMQQLFDLVGRQSFELQIIGEQQQCQSLAA